ncbi:hypothetical protein [Paenibacillus terrigena]|uniref:hypothetical protein n=1 Tax=Paenibacillus terrigena TaxID=369333 RepID=UPI0028D07FEF|nr:hypothetical protein [Paenibacillus terrigena]
MRTNGKWRIAALAALSTTLLMGSSVSFAAESNAPAGTVVENRPDVAPTKIERQNVGYVDGETGTVYYNVSGRTGNDYWNVVVEQKPDGKISRWGEGFDWVYKGAREGEPVVSIPYDVNMDWKHYHYDWQDDSVHDGLDYILSPNGKWSFVEQMQYKLDGQSRYYYWLRNTETGEIEEWFEHSATTTGATWMADNRIILKRYSEKDQQDEIVSYDPESKKWERIELGRFLGYNLEQNRMLLDRNGPFVREEVYDFHTKKSRPLRNEAERNQFNDWSQPVYDEKLKLDPDLDIWKLPVHPIAVVRDRLHTVHVDREKIEVPYVINYKGKGTRWIPMRQLAESLHWKLKIQTRKAGSKEVKYRYTIQAGPRQIELTPDNSKIFNDHVFMTQAQLKTLGYSDISITSNR